MKKTTTIFFVLSIWISAFGQTTKTIRKVVPIQEKLTYSLDGGLTASVNGKSRVFFEVKLPPNTVEWYYIFSSQADVESMKDASSKINLVSQLTRVVDPTGATATATSSLLAPSGSTQCNVYLFRSHENADKFYNKTETNWTPDLWSYIEDGSIEAATDGKKKITNITEGICYIGIQNPSFNSPTNVAIEVAAVVEEEETNLNEWSTETKNELFNTYKTNLITNGIADNVASEIANCVVNKMTTSYTPADFSKMSESQTNEIEKNIADSCVQTLQGGAKTEEQQKGKTYGSLGWKAYENGDIDNAIAYSKKALTLDNTLGWVEANLGLFYLIKNDEITATDYYVSAISNMKKDKINAKNNIKAAIDDINNALKKYPDLKGYKEILQQLQQEYDQL